MKNKIYSALSEIKAGEELKQSTYAFLQKKAFDKKRPYIKRLAVAFSSIVIMVFAGLLSYNLYFTGVSVIDIDVNPSIELTLNRFDHVIDLYAYNNDGQEVLDKVNIKYKSYNEALKILIDEMVKMGHIEDTGLFTATLLTKNSVIEKELLNSIRNYIDNILLSDGSNIEQDIFSVDDTIKAHSHGHNLTPAKYLAILDLQEVLPAATFEGCRNHSISDIREQIHDHTDKEKVEKHNSPSGSSESHDNQNHITESNGLSDEKHSPSGDSNKNHESKGTYSGGSDTRDKEHNSSNGSGDNHETSKPETHESNEKNDNTANNENSSGSDNGISDSQHNSSSGSSEKHESNKSESHGKSERSSSSTESGSHGNDHGKGDYTNH